MGKGELFVKGVIGSVSSLRRLERRHIIFISAIAFGLCTILNNSQYFFSASDVQSVDGGLNGMIAGQPNDATKDNLLIITDKTGFQKRYKALTNSTVVHTFSGGFNFAVIYDNLPGPTQIKAYMSKPDTNGNQTYIVQELPDGPTELFDRAQMNGLAGARVIVETPLTQGGLFPNNGNKGIRVADNGDNTSTVYLGDGNLMARTLPIVVTNGDLEGKVHYDPKVASQMTAVAQTSLPATTSTPASVVQVKPTVTYHNNEPKGAQSVDNSIDPKVGLAVLAGSVGILGGVLYSLFRKKKPVPSTSTRAIRPPNEPAPLKASKQPNFRDTWMDELVDLNHGKPDDLGQMIEKLSILTENLVLAFSQLNIDLSPEDKQLIASSRVKQREMAKQFTEGTNNEALFAIVNEANELFNILERYHGKQTSTAG